MMRLQLIYKPKLRCNQPHVSHHYHAPQQILVPTHLSTHSPCSFCSCDAFKATAHTVLWPNIRLVQCKIRYVINERDVAIVGQLYVRWPKVNESSCSSASLPLLCTRSRFLTPHNTHVGNSRHWFGKLVTKLQDHTSHFHYIVSFQLGIYGKGVLFGSCWETSHMCGFAKRKVAKHTTFIPMSVSLFCQRGPFK